MAKLTNDQREAVDAMSEVLNMLEDYFPSTLNGILERMDLSDEEFQRLLQVLENM